MFVARRREGKMTNASSPPSYDFRYVFLSTIIFRHIYKSIWISIYIYTPQVLYLRLQNTRTAQMKSYWCERDTAILTDIKLKILSL